MATASAVVAKDPVMVQYSAVRAVFESSQPVEVTLKKLQDELQFDTWNKAAYEWEGQKKLMVNDVPGFEEVIRQRENEDELLMLYHHRHDRWFSFYTKDKKTLPYMENFHVGSPLIARHFMDLDRKAANNLPIQITLIGNETYSQILYDTRESIIPIGMNDAATEEALRAAGKDYDDKTIHFIRRILGYPQ